MTAYALRTRFKKDIVAEFMVPRKNTGNVIILCDGMPTMPRKHPVLEFFQKKGYWVFHPRYRGTWESGGTFLKKSPHEDIIDLIDQLPRGFVSLWDGKKYAVTPKKIILVGSSFGGPAQLLVARDPRVTKVITFSPVIDWKARSKAEPLPWLEIFTRQAFGEGYRFSSKDWKKLGKGEFYDPMAHVADIPGRKVMIIHARDDDSVPYRPAVKFSKATGSELWMLPKGGHMGAGAVMERKFWKRILRFLKKK